MHYASGHGEEFFLINPSAFIRGELCLLESHTVEFLMIKIQDGTFVNVVEIGPYTSQTDNLEIYYGTW